MDREIDRQRLLLTVWNWLPAFQAVAETEHLPTASSRLRLTPSALSRTVSTLEDHLGRPLFARVGRTLALNAHGRRLLSGMTSAHAALSASLEALSSGEARGPLYACACGPLAQAVLVPAIQDLQQHSAKVIPHVYGYEQEEALELLRAGSLDIVFGPSRSAERDLTSTFLGEVSNGVYCGRTHPLFAVDAHSSAEVLRHAFVASSSRIDGKPGDPFLPGVERRIELFVNQGHVMVELATAGHLLAVLPDLVAASLVQTGQLRRLPFPTLPSTPLFATSTKADGRSERVRAMTEQVGQLLAGGGSTVRTDRGEAAGGLEPSGSAGWLSVGDELLRRGEHTAAQRAYDTAHARRVKSGAATAADSGRHAVATARVLVRRGKYADAETACEGALRGLQGDPELASELEATLSLARCFRGEPARAKEALERARAHAVAAASRSAREGARAWIQVARAEGNLLYEADRAREALHAYERGLSASREVGDTWEESIALCNVGEAHAAAGDVERATAALDHSFRVKDTLGDRWGQAHVLGALARLALARNDARQAEAELQRALSLATPMADPKLTSTLHCTLGWTRARLGQHDDALQGFKLALRDAERCDARGDATRALLGLCEVLLARGRTTAARAHAERALSLARERDAKAHLARALFAMGEIAMATDATDEAAGYYREAYVAGAGAPAHGAGGSPLGRPG